MYQRRTSRSFGASWKRCPRPPHSRWIGRHCAVCSRTDMAADFSIASEAKARADALIAQMTPEEKAGQLIHPFYVPGPMGEAIDQGIAQGLIGGVGYLM